MRSPPSVVRETTLMETARSNLVIPPDSQQSEHASRQLAVNRQMGPDKAVPVFYGAAGTAGFRPSIQEVIGDCPPARCKPLHRLFGSWPNDASTHPRPARLTH